MKPDECADLDRCHKVRMVFDKDLEDFQYAGSIRQICAICTVGKTNRVSVATMERQAREPDFIKRHVFEALYAGIAEAGGDIELARRLHARTKFRLVNMSDEQLEVLAKTIAPPEQSIESVYTAFQSARAQYNISASEWMKDLPPHTEFPEEHSGEI